MELHNVEFNPHASVVGQNMPPCFGAHYHRFDMYEDEAWVIAHICEHLVEKVKGDKEAALTVYEITSTTITFFNSTRMQKTLDAQEITFGGSRIHCEKPE
jgi:hypothetical protein